MIAESRTVNPPAPVAPPAVARDIELLQRQVHDLVRERLLESIGSGGNWTVQFRRSSDDDTFFSETLTDMIAWDVASRLVPPAVPNRARLVG